MPHVRIAPRPRPAAPALHPHALHSAMLDVVARRRQPGACRARSRRTRSAGQSPWSCRRPGSPSPGPRARTPSCPACGATPAAARRRAGSRARRAGASSCPSCRAVTSSAWSRCSARTSRRGGRRPPPDGRDHDRGAGARRAPRRASPPRSSRTCSTARACPSRRSSSGPARGRRPVAGRDRRLRPPAQPPPPRRGGDPRMLPDASLLRRDDGVHALLPGPVTDAALRLAERLPAFALAPFEADPDASAPPCARRRWRRRRSRPARPRRRTRSAAASGCWSGWPPSSPASCAASPPRRSVRSPTTRWSRRSRPTSSTTAT